MKVARTIAEYSAFVHDPTAGRVRPSVAFVPTMGALHSGHRALFRLARAESDLVVVSIFVNPLQFAPGEDYARYPRPVETDLAACEAEGVDIVFLPSVSELYPAGRQVSLSAGALGSVLEGRFRPGHFDGVLTVVLKLFNIVRPDVAIFGRKDAQQLACIQRMVQDLNVSVRIVGAETIRDPDGLAISSRNAYLSAAERQTALALSAALRAAAAASDVPTARAEAAAVLAGASTAAPPLVLDYATLAHPGTFAEVPDDYTGEAVLLIAARVGSTRLIDNATLTFVGSDDGEDGEPG